ncbi:MAG: alpha/beta fold hydrolase [Alphaproteobacteria bacterium]|nr:alpha/beta fold hydrolase [Alphaproteobacteria bacterium]
MPNLPPLLLLPGLLCNAELWQNQINALKSIVDCRVADTTRHDSIAAIAEDVLRDAPPRFALAGLSMGGYVAMEIMRRAPERVTKLALLDTSARADTPEQKERRRLLLAMASHGQFKGVTPRLLPLLIHPNRLHDEALTHIIMHMAEKVGRDAFANQQTAIMNRSDSRDSLKNIACPTLVIGGRQDVLTPPELVEEIAAGIKGAHLEIIEDCGHLSALEQPQKVNSLMKAWLDA